MVTGSDLQESRKAIELAERYAGLCYATVGVHPCSAEAFDRHPGGSDALLHELFVLATDAKARGLAVAYGEIGLDYDRLFLTGKEQQLKYFEAQLDVAVEVQLPLFLHSRAASEDFERLLRGKVMDLPKRGLVHSFTGSMEEMERMVALGLDIGVNGCSMKTEGNLEVVRAVPLERLQIETDGPWVCFCFDLIASFMLFCRDSRSLVFVFEYCMIRTLTLFCLENDAMPCQTSNTTYDDSAKCDHHMHPPNTKSMPRRSPNQSKRKSGQKTP